VDSQLRDISAQPAAPQPSLRPFVYAVTAAGMVLLSVLLFSADWHGDAYLHRMLETASSMIAIMIGVMALTRYYSLTDPAFLMVGTAFVGTGLLDLYHAVLTSPGLAAYLPSRMVAVVPWSWLSSRLFLGTMLLISCLAARSEAKPSRWGTFQPHQVYPVAAGLLVASCALFLVIPLPQAIYPEWPVKRPQEFVSSLLFALALIGHLRTGAWARSRYDHWLILGIIVEMMTQAVIMARSASLHDPFFTAAHVTKPMGYLCVLTGLVMNMYESFTRLEVSLRETEQAGALLREAHQELERRVTERTAQLQESQRFMFSVLEHLPNMVFVKEAATLRFVHFNKAGEVLTGIPRHELLGKSDHDFFPREEAEAFVAKDRLALEQRTLIEITEEPIHTRRQGVRILHTKKIPIFDPHGAPQFLLGISEDITERQRLQRARMTLQQAIDHGLDGVALLDEEGRFTYMNPAHAAMYDFCVEDLLGRHWHTLYHPEWTALIEQMAMPALQSDGHWQGEVVGKKRSGDPFHVDLSLALIGGGDPNHRTVVCTCRDITKRKRMERDLIAAKDAAESAARAKSEFLATMSHEIRTPMNGVIGMTGLLLDTPLTAEQREHAETVRRSGEALLTIINDILDFSKIEAGKLSLELVDFDLRTTIEETLDLLAEQAHRKQLELTGLIDASVPTDLRGDPGRLRQVVTNLVGNAVKFTEQGEVVLRLTTEQVDEARVTLRFDVMDTGIGISTEHLSRLFQSFSQADGSTTRRFGGTGLGLAISKQLVELMGGVIGVESRPEGGSRFWFTVQLDRQRQPLSPARPVTDLSGLRMCLIDDNATNRMLLEHHARAWGMTHASAEDGPKALAILREAQRSGHPFDLALVDMQMPEMDGMELATHIHADPALRGIKLVLLTSLVRRGDATLAQNRGFAAYLTKPIHQHQLYECLRLVMGTAPSAATTPQPLVTVHSMAEARSRAAGRILLAEDNVINQKVAVKMIERLGYHLDVVADGGEAVEALSRIPYLLVFMDCQMPEMDGFEATRHIRAMEGSARHTPIIAMTANAMQGDREHCLSVGMDDYISKPISSEAVAAILRRWLPDDTTSVPSASAREPRADSIDRSGARH